MSFGGGGTQAEVAKADRPTIEISIAAKADGVELNIRTIWWQGYGRASNGYGYQGTSSRSE